MKPKYLFLFAVLLLAASCNPFSRPAKPTPSPVAVPQQPGTTSTPVIQPKSGVAENAKLDELFRIQIGHPVLIEDEKLQLKLLSVQDSRCPADPTVECVSAGSASVKINLAKAGKSLGDVTASYLVVSGKKIPVATVGGYQIELANLEPAARVGKIAQTDYTAVISVSKK